MIQHIIDSMYPQGKGTEVKDSKRPEKAFIFPADSSVVNDNRGHFPIPDEDHARNAIARVNQYKAVPDWYTGDMNLEELVKHVVSEVHKKFPKIEISEEAKKPGKQVKDSGENPLIKYVEWAMVPDGDTVSVEVEEIAENLGLEANESFLKRYKEWIKEAKRHAEKRAKEEGLELEFCDGDYYSFTVETYRDEEDFEDFFNEEHICAVVSTRSADKFREYLDDAGKDYYPEDTNTFYIMGDLEGIEEIKEEMKNYDIPEDEVDFVFKGSEEIEDSKSSKKWVLGERLNRQTGVYYKVKGQMSKKEIKEFENPIYGYMIAHQFDSEEELKKEVERLRSEGYRVYDSAGEYPYDDEETIYAVVTVRSASKFRDYLDDTRQEYTPEYTNTFYIKGDLDTIEDIKEEMKSYGIPEDEVDFVFKGSEEIEDSVNDSSEIRLAYDGVKHYLEDPRAYGLRDAWIKKDPELDQYTASVVQLTGHTSTYTTEDFMRAREFVFKHARHAKKNAVKDNGAVAKALAPILIEKMLESKISDSFDSAILDIESLESEPTEENLSRIAIALKEAGLPSLRDENKREILAVAEDQNGKLLYSYKQKAWKEVKDCSGVTTSADVNADIPGKAKPVKDSVTEDLISKLFAGETVVKPNNWSDEEWNTFIVNFEDFQLDDNPENLKLQVNGSEAKLVESDTVEDSRQGDVMSHSWEEFIEKVESAECPTCYSGHTVVVGDKAYTIEIKETEKLEDACDYKIEDDKEYSMDQLISNPPLWIADKDIWKRAVAKATHNGEKNTTVVVPIVLYKRLGGTKALNKKEKAERTAADEKRMSAEVSRENVEDSAFNEIKVGDTLRIVRGNHPGEYAEVLDIAEDGSFLLKNLRTGEEFNEPKGLFGVYVTVIDSMEQFMVEDSNRSLRGDIQAMIDAGNATPESILSRILVFLQLQGIPVEVDPEDMRFVWLPDDDHKFWVSDLDKIMIHYPETQEVKEFSLMGTEWYDEIKRLSK